MTVHFEARQGLAHGLRLHTDFVGHLSLGKTALSVNDVKGHDTGVRESERLQLPVPIVFQHPCCGGHQATDGPFLEVRHG